MWQTYGYFRELAECNAAERNRRLGCIQCQRDKSAPVEEREREEYFSAENNKNHCREQSHSNELSDER